jgi:ketopantoate reductase
VVRDANCAELIEHHADEMRSVLDEIHYVLSLDDRLAAAFEGLPRADTGELFDMVAKAVASYGSHYPSTWHDSQRGASLEITSLNGYVVHIATERGIPVPHNAALVEASKAKCCGCVAKQELMGGMTGDEIKSTMAEDQARRRAYR